MYLYFTKVIKFVEVVVIQEHSCGIEQIVLDQHLQTTTTKILSQKFITLSQIHIHQKLLHQEWS